MCVDVIKLGTTNPIIVFISSFNDVWLNVTVGRGKKKRKKELSLKRLQFHSFWKGEKAGEKRLKERGKYRKNEKKTYRNLVPLLR